MSERQKPPRGKSAPKKEKPKPEPFEIVIEFPDVPLEDTDLSAPPKDSTKSAPKRGTQRLTFPFRKGS